jgi:AcrR family transcriptional regulator
VLSAALAILDEVGPDGFTVRAIADRAGVAPMTIYNHFDGISCVIETICIDGFHELARAIGVNSGNPAADLLESGRGYRRFATQHPGYFTALFLHNFRGFVSTEAMTAAGVHAISALVDLVTRGQEAGVIRHGNPNDIALVLWSSCHGFVALERKGTPSLVADLDVKYELLLTSLQRGLRP